MKTAEERLKIHLPFGVMIKDAVIVAMKEYALEAIKEDRKNVAKHADILYMSLPKDNARIPTYEVDAETIINAPLPELK